jgi:hypothetical protein
MGDNDLGGYLPCLMCDAEIPVSRDEVGQDVYCSYCMTSMKLRKDEKEDDLYLEEDDWD